ncbi:DUF4270 domain-containing protein [Psychroserpens sp. S379A]|uniref:DUF4270 domain-containing protein n=1 Tax=Psychroserpens sp. S379A TaxID=3415137 RepID=UPI003C79ED43
MKNKTIALRNSVVLVLLTSLFIACDKDFATIESDIINNNTATSFDVLSRDFDVIAYTKPLEPVQTNSLPINSLGVYNDAVYGQTIANVVTQLSPLISDPDFGTDAVLDSVVITIPYFSTLTNFDSDNNPVYKLDSVFGNAPMKLSIYESNYFLRDFDPNSSINDPQIYYSNQNTGTGVIPDTQLEGTLLYSDDNFEPEDDIIELENEDGEVTQRLAPALRIAFNADETEDQAEIAYWQDKIIAKSGQPELSNTNNFKDYFRGLYFKVEPIAGEGTMSLLNFGSSNANITLYYTNNTDSDPTQSTFIINFTENRVNFLFNDFNIPDGDDSFGDEKLYLKGGKGSVAAVQLFDGENIDEDDTINSFESFKNEFVEVDENGKFIKSKKLINEANLVFYVDQNSVSDIVEPERIYLYDMNNNIPLIDYLFDSANTVSPVDSRTSHSGRLQRDENGKGLKYKIRITEHINNLLLKDSTNVNLGLAVSGNINLENNAQQFDVLNSANATNKVPMSSIITPRGTVLYGNNTSDEEKKLYLEIFFTEPNN